MIPIATALQKTRKFLQTCFEEKLSLEDVVGLSYSDTDGILLLEAGETEDSAPDDGASYVRRVNVWQPLNLNIRNRLLANQDYLFTYRALRLVNPIIRTYGPRFYPLVKLVHDLVDDFVTMHDDTLTELAQSYLDMLIGSSGPRLAYDLVQRKQQQHAPAVLMDAVKELALPQLLHRYLAYSETGPLAVISHSFHHFPPDPFSGQGWYGTVLGTVNENLMGNLDSIRLRTPEHPPSLSSKDRVIAFTEYGFRNAAELREVYDQAGIGTAVQHKTLSQMREVLLTLDRHSALVPADRESPHDLDATIAQVSLELLLLKLPYPDHSQLLGYSPDYPGSGKLVYSDGPLPDPAHMIDLQSWLETHQDTAARHDADLQNRGLVLWQPRYARQRFAAYGRSLGHAARILLARNQCLEQAHRFAWQSLYLLEPVSGGVKAGGVYHIVQQTNRRLHDRLKAGGSQACDLLVLNMLQTLLKLGQAVDPFADETAFAWLDDAVQFTTREGIPDAALEHLNDMLEPDAAFLIQELSPLMEDRHKILAYWREIVSIICQRGLNLCRKRVQPRADRIAETPSTAKALDQLELTFWTIHALIEEVLQPERILEQFQAQSQDALGEEAGYELQESLDGAGTQQLHEEIEAYLSHIRPFDIDHHLMAQAADNQLALPLISDEFSIALKVYLYLLIYRRDVSNDPDYQQRQQELADLKEQIQLRQATVYGYRHEVALMRFLYALFEQEINRQMRRSEGSADIQVTLDIDGEFLQEHPTSIQFVIANKNPTTARELRFELKPRHEEYQIEFDDSTVGELAIESMALLRTRSELGYGEAPWVVEYRIRPLKVDTLRLEYSCSWSEGGDRAALPWRQRLLDVRALTTPQAKLTINNDFQSGSYIEDPRKFIGRVSLFEQYFASLAGTPENELLWGPVRTGKTSFMIMVRKLLLNQGGARQALHLTHRFENEMNWNHYIPVYISLEAMQVARVLDWFVETIHSKVKETLKEVRGKVDIGTVTPDQVDAARTAVFNSESSAMLPAMPERVRDYLRQLVDAFSEKRSFKLLLFIDEFDKTYNDYDNALRVNLRWLLEHTRESTLWMICSTRGPYEDRFLYGSAWYAVLRPRPVEYFTRKEVMALLKRGFGEEIDFANRMRAEIYNLTGGQPYYTQFLCSELLDHLYVLEELGEPTRIIRKPEIDAAFQAMQSQTHSIGIMHPKIEWGRATGLNKLILLTMIESHSVKPVHVEVIQDSVKHRLSTSDVDDVGYFNAWFHQVFYEGLDYWTHVSGYLIRSDDLHNTYYKLSMRLIVKWYDGHDKAQQEGMREQAVEDAMRAYARAEQRRGSYEGDFRMRSPVVQLILTAFSQLDSYQCARDELIDMVWDIVNTSSYAGKLSYDAVGSWINQAEADLRMYIFTNRAGQHLFKDTTMAHWLENQLDIGHITIDDILQAVVNEQPDR